ncbi:arrestin red cell-like [Clytia hemisphaerica]|uniref:Arrestin C-terminal-like domain-containing protein n=1 Tax=Clytia hemisphaerica TaxID=252671 RepID=A0A7M5VFM2_9CNID|eukprot:TCONS_00052830-protein
MSSNNTQNESKAPESTSNSSNHKSSSSSTKKTGTRVFKKSTPNGKVTVYIGKRDFYDHIEHCEPVDGVVLVDRDHIKDKTVFCHVLAAFRYGREDLDVLGLTFRKDLYLAKKQVYPPEIEEEEPLTRLQERLIKKLGKNAYPFKFMLPKNTPSSVTLQPAPGDTGKPCGVDYELRVFLSETTDEKEYKKNSVRLAIRKITYAPSSEISQPPPMIETSKEFMMCPHPLFLEASLDKEMYYHGESIAVNVHISNRSNKTVKKIKLAVRQYADICLFSTAQYKCPVATIETEEGFPVGQSGTLSKVIHITPLLADNKDKRGLALDGQLKHEDTNLASSTIMDSATQKENLGIIVHYKVKIRLVVNGIGNDLAVELPFTLSHPKPASPSPSPVVQRRYSEITQEQDAEQPPIDSDLIKFDTDGPERQAHDDDLVFEEFARMRVRGEHQGEAHA